MPKTKFKPGRISKTPPVRPAWPTGRIICQVRWMNDAELKKEGWGNRGGGVALTLDDGGVLYASRDEEGNGPGMLFGLSPKGEPVVVHPTM